MSGVFEYAAYAWSKKCTGRVVAFPFRAIDTSKPTGRNEPHLPIGCFKRGEDRVGTKCVVSAVVLKVSVTKDADSSADGSRPHASIAGSCHGIHAVLREAVFL